MRRQSMVSPAHWRSFRRNGSVIAPIFRTANGSSAAGCCGERGNKALRGRPQKCLFTGEVSARIKLRRCLPPGQRRLKRVLALEAAALRMKEMAEEEIQ